MPPPDPDAGRGNTDRLESYFEKRDFSATPEPRGDDERWLLVKMDDDEEGGS